ncbi:MAG: preprotein translocase subunit SecG [Planctomycetota bacterium]
MKPSEVRGYLKRGAIAGSFFLLALLLYLFNLGGALTFYALVTAFVLVLMILIQSGRGGGLAALGGMDSEAVLGTHSATPIAKATYVVGALFVFTCMLAARLGLVGRTSQPDDIAPDQPPAKQQKAPAKKAPPVSAPGKATKSPSGKAGTQEAAEGQQKGTGE